MSAGRDWDLIRVRRVRGRSQIKSTQSEHPRCPAGHAAGGSDEDSGQLAVELKNDSFHSGVVNDRQAPSNDGVGYQTGQTVSAFWLVCF